jgi:hypothetical protein
MFLSIMFCLLRKEDVYFFISVLYCFLFVLMRKVCLNASSSVVGYEVECELKLPTSLCIDKLIKCLKEDIHRTDDVPLRDVPLDCEVIVALRRERLTVNLKGCL